MDEALSVPLRLQHTSAPIATPHADVLQSIRDFLVDYAHRTGSTNATDAPSDTDTAATATGGGGSSVLSSQLSRLASGLDPNTSNVMAIFEQFENIDARLPPPPTTAAVHEEQEEEEQLRGTKQEDVDALIKPDTQGADGDDDAEDAAQDDDDEAEARRRRKAEKEEKKRRKEEKRKRRESAQA
ncbi:uncharacterized protein PFL1_05688 [Pseudozyma flocculosa PF-1]|uniref:Uncharacterized protein n=2 Tax=Pseudozyma flocculosa TaxID=84751 RepID=A0A5C3F9S7_9BASI|nr:uncharacterized protein PFL1_05688 [Pseudozyma flocculosa PF-1]EPQ26709.1 hypothetical protein PFL1_05688 [Pseudozyma flocculosa PF-1]SPO40970.1 uncharacterized protein PSFLO_06452 [Pseudozyma flocculosa]